jgi:hypothetical protein
MIPSTVPHNFVSELNSVSHSYIIPDDINETDHAEFIDWIRRNFWIDSQHGINIQNNFWQLTNDAVFPFNNNPTVQLATIHMDGFIINQENEVGELLAEYADRFNEIITP